MLDVRKQPVLAEGEDIELARRWRDHGDQKAFDRLVNSHLRLVASLAKSVVAPHVTKEDLIAEGMVGLVEAAKSYDPEKGFRFATWAKRAITWAMHDAARLKKDIRIAAGAVPIDMPIAAPIEEEDCFAAERIELEDRLPGLGDREKQIIALRYLGDDHVALSTVGNQFGISGERTRQIEIKAIEKLKRAAQ